MEQYKTSHLDFSDSFTWDNLPQVALVQIFKHLDENNRKNAALVCRQWASAFKTASLWQDMEFEFNTRNRKQEKRALNFMDRFGHCLQRVGISVLCIENNSRGISKNSLKNLEETLKKIGKKSCLRKFDMCFLMLERDWVNQRKKDSISVAVEKCLGTQTKLKIFRMSLSEFDECYGLDILESLAKNNQSSLHELCIDHFLRPGNNMIADIRYVNLMSQFKCLKFLSINYGCIGESTLKIVVENCKSTLQDLKISCSNIEPRSHRISSQTWKSVAKICPSLKVFFEICKIPQFREFEHMLVAGVPLRGFDYWPGYGTKGERENWELDNLLVRLTHFKDSLQDINLYFSENDDFQSSLVYDLLIEASKNLKDFIFFGLLDSEIIYEVLSSQVMGVIRLRNCFITVPTTCAEIPLLLKGAKQLCCTLYHSNDAWFDVQVVKPPVRRG